MLFWGNGSESRTTETPVKLLPTLTEGALLAFFAFFSLSGPYSPYSSSAFPIATCQDLYGGIAILASNDARRLVVNKVMRKLGKSKKLQNIVHEK